MPHSHFGQLPQAQDVGEAEHVHLLALKLVGLVAVPQRQRARVSVLPENDDPHLGVGACGCHRRDSRPVGHQRT